MILRFPSRHRALWASWKPFLVALFFFLPPSPGEAREGDIVTFWPLFDYRRSEAVDYTSLHLLGPFLKYERRGDEREYAFRPFYSTARDSQGLSRSEFLFPLASGKGEPKETGFQGLRLLDYHAGEKENEFTLFPFLFYGEGEEQERYFAFFPFGGKMSGRFFRDEIRFALFPLYGWTRSGDTEVTNILWPIFAKVRGENEGGWKLWPFYGAGEKEGVYRKRFYLWPVFFRYDLKLDTENPTRIRTVFPFFVSRESPQRSSRTWFWPFFSHTEDRVRGFEEWHYPWPLLGRTEGDHREGVRLLPFYSDLRKRESRKRWYLWPLFKVQQTRSEVLESDHFRVLWFLYSDFREDVYADPLPPERRVALWPLFTYEQSRGVSRFHFLSLLEPFLPESESLERNWSPLWRLYQRKWDRQGNEASTLLWNLYWKERRGEDLAMELFPLFQYRRAEGERDFSFLKGLFRYRSDGTAAEISLLYLPRGIRWGNGWQE